jgi:ribosomal protein S7
MCFVNVLLIKLVNSFIKDGNKVFSEKVITFVIIELKKLYGYKYSFVLLQAFNNITPKISLKNKKKAGISYKIPFVLKTNESLLYVMK